MYMKNVCTTLISAKWSNPNSDVALVINTDVPATYSDLLKGCGVNIVQIPFDEFVFDEQYTWGLPFYKLCALYHMVREYN